MPNGISIPSVRVIEATLTGNFEMLIGMDIISHGDFSFTNVNGKSCFSFRIPSIKKIDYVEENKMSKKKPKWLKSSKGYKGGKKRKWFFSKPYYRAKESCKVLWGLLFATFFKL